MKYRRCSHCLPVVSKSTMVLLLWSEAAYWPIRRRREKEEQGLQVIEFTQLRIATAAHVKRDISATSICDMKTGSTSATGKYSSSDVYIVLYASHTNAPFPNDPYKRESSSHSTNLQQREYALLYQVSAGRKLPQPRQQAPKHISESITSC